MVEFVTASHNEEILKANLLQSDVFLYVPPHIQRGYVNIAKAYNAAKAEGIICYVHHDVYLPSDFIINISIALNTINKRDKNWGVLGVAGVRLNGNRKEIHGYIQDRGRNFGSPNNLPAEVDTLDELLLITHGDFKFDENLPLHFYGADICMQAKLQGRKCYAINAYCHHNSTLPYGYRSIEFKECEKYFREKYIHHLPIATTCSLVTY